jgi:hypothetical protein
VRPKDLRKHLDDKRKSPEKSADYPADETEMRKLEADLRRQEKKSSKEEKEANARIIGKIVTESIKAATIAERQAPQGKENEEEESDEEDFTVDPDEACYDLYSRDFPAKKMYKYRYTSARKFVAYLGAKFPQVGSKCKRTQVECSDLKRSFPCEVYCETHAFDAVHKLWKEHLSKFCRVHRPLESIPAEDRPAYLEYIKLMDEKAKARYAAAQAAEEAAARAAEKAAKEATKKGASNRKDVDARKRKAAEDENDSSSSEDSSDEESTRSEDELLGFFAELLDSYRESGSSFKQAWKKKQTPPKVTFVLRKPEAYLPIPIIEGGRTRGYTLRLPEPLTFHTGDTKRIDLGIIAHFPEDMMLMVSSLQGRTPNFFNVATTFFLSRDKQNGFNHIIVDIAYTRKLPDVLFLEPGIIVAALTMMPVVAFTMENVYSMNSETHEVRSHEEAIKNAIPAGHEDDPAMKEDDPEESEAGSVKGSRIYYNKAAVFAKGKKRASTTLVEDKGNPEAVTSHKPKEAEKKNHRESNKANLAPKSAESTYAQALQGPVYLAQMPQGLVAYGPTSGGTRHNGRAVNDWSVQERRGGYQGGGGYGSMLPPSERNRRESMEALNRSRSEKLQKYAARKWIPSDE